MGNHNFISMTLQIFTDGQNVGQIIIGQKNHAFWRGNFKRSFAFFHLLLHWRDFM